MLIILNSAYMLVQEMENSHYFSSLVISILEINDSC